MEVGLEGLLELGDCCRWLFDDESSIWSEERGGLYTIYLFPDVSEVPSIACQGGQCWSTNMLVALWSKPHGGGGVMLGEKESLVNLGAVHSRVFGESADLTLVGQWQPQLVQLVPTPSVVGSGW